MEPLFVTCDQVLRANEESLRRHGGSAGIRDDALLRWAIHQPLNDFFCASADLLGIAADYAYHIAEAQAFLDGNKRTAITRALMGIGERRLDKVGMATIVRELFG